MNDCWLVKRFYYFRTRKIGPWKIATRKNAPTLTLTQTLTQVGICWVAFAILKIDYLTQIKTEKQLFQVFF